MLLRESGSAGGVEVDVQALADPAIESGVRHGRVLLEFASAVVGRDDARLAHTREALRAEMGGTGVADTAAVASNFERMVRIADAIGIELGDWMESFTAQVRTELALERLKERRDDAAATSPDRQSPGRPSPLGARRFSS